MLITLEGSRLQPWGCAKCFQCMHWSWLPGQSWASDPPPQCTIPFIPNGHVTRHTCTGSDVVMMSQYHFRTLHYVKKMTWPLTHCVMHWQHVTIKNCKNRCYDDGIIPQSHAGTHPCDMRCHICTGLYKKLSPIQFIDCIGFSALLITGINLVKNWCVWS